MKKIFFIILSFFVYFQSISTAQVNLEYGLVGCWNFTGNAIDVSGYNNNGMYMELF